MEWDCIEQRIVHDDESKWDQKAMSHQLQVSNTGKLALMNGNGEHRFHSLSDLAVTQMCQKLDIPVKYYKRLPEAMQSQVANYDLGRMNGQNFLLRGRGEIIRAFLSDRYILYDNSQIAETVENLLAQADVTVNTFVLEETHMFLKIISEEIMDPTTGLKAGILIGNSEVGMGSVSVEPFVFRLSCTNDLVVTYEESFRHPHIHLSASELSNRMAIGISNTFEVANSVLDTFLQTRREPVPDPVETIRKLAESRSLSRKFTDQVVNCYQSDPEPNRFGVINAFTNAAHGLAPLPRIEMERYAGSLLEGEF